MSESKDKKIIKSLICPYCADTFTRESVLKAHMETCEDKDEVDEHGNRPEPFTNPDVAPMKQKDPAQMTEIEKLEFELAKKKAEAKVIEQVKIEKQQQIEVERVNKGLHEPIVESGKFRHLMIQNHDKLASLFDEQDREGFDHVTSILTPIGLIHSIFKKR